MTDLEKQEAFMADLLEISRKHGVYVGGCGCCGSPFLRIKDTKLKYMWDVDRYRGDRVENICAEEDPE